jgi:TPR repeat protein
MALSRVPKEMYFVALLVPSLTVALCSFGGCKKSPAAHLTIDAATECKGIDPTLLAKAEAGDAIAQRKLGYAFDLGQGCSQSYALAALWYRKAADQGDAKAQYDLGLLCDKGEGVPQDYAQASTWFRKAAEQGNSAAQFYLGSLYDGGHGVTQDPGLAAMWYRKAADQGQASAQYALGRLYDQGEGVPQDYSLAAFWYQKAAEQGHAEAQYFIGYSYYYGQGVSQDRSQGVAWWKKAAGQGNEYAQKSLSAMQREDEGGNLSTKLRSYWSTTIRVDADMDSFWLPDEERTCKTYPDDKGRVSVVACNASGTHRDHNIPVTFWGDLDRNIISDWKCRREKGIFKDEFVCRAIN